MHDARTLRDHAVEFHEFYKGNFVLIKGKLVFSWCLEIYI